MMTYICPICGYDGLDEPAYEYGDSPSFEYCPCCLFQFGYHDYAVGISHEQWRQRWIARGMPWHDNDGDPDNPMPPGWDPRRQLLNIGITM